MHPDVADCEKPAAEVLEELPPAGDPPFYQPSIVDPDPTQNLKRATRIEMADLFKRVENGELTNAAAIRLSGYSPRHFQRKLSAYRLRGEASLVHQAVGKPSNNKLPEELVANVEEILKEWGPGGGPTLFSELLQSEKGISISVESLRQIMIRMGYWEEKQRSKAHKRARERKACYGQMVQMDTSEHAWFGDKFPVCYLISTIDDATGRVFGRFYDADSTLTNMDCILRYLRLFGRPVSLYVDRASHFKVNFAKGKELKPGEDPPETQLERACRELDIRIIHAHSPQAKGRIERLFKTLQNRLLNVMRIHKRNTIEEANKLLEDGFLQKYSDRFGRPPASSVNLHRTIEGLNVEGILSVQEVRTVNKDHTFKLDGEKYQLHMRAGYPDLSRKKIVIEKRVDGSMKVNYRGLYIHFSTMR
jgi:hypothetical protein